MPRPLYPREKIPDTHRIGGWMGSRVGLNDVEKRKILTGNQTPAVQLIA
jgi:hypothetical protein